LELGQLSLERFQIWLLLLEFQRVLLKKTILGPGHQLLLTIFQRKSLKKIANKALHSDGNSAALHCRR
tara:strand:- start:3185 stop:3388 length:204 start_codon:yes stop_codon:yes gene_type:complete